MKSFLTTTKGKAVAGIATVAVIGAIVAIVLSMNSGYRTIAVEELNGTTKVTNSGKTSDAYIGQHLDSGDDVKVSSQSDLTLALDTDKYVYAKENTHFWVEAQGKTNDTRTVIKLEEGSTLSRIDKKLASAESFDVETPNATMSVRGTVFKVETAVDSAGDTYTVVDVFEGAVFVQVHMEDGVNTEESRTLNAGERAVIRSNSSLSEFVKSEDTDDVVYDELTKEEALFLGKAIDEGRSLSIGKDLLYDIVEITPHDFSAKGEEVEATCTEEGYYFDMCAICGAQGEKHVIKATGHSADGSVEGDSKCIICGEEVEGVTKATDEDTDNENEYASEQDKCADDAHKYEKKTEAATCIADGYTEEVCSVCGDIKNKVVIAATGHNYVVTKTEATCTEDGSESNICSVCGEGTTTKIPLLGHEFVSDHTEATCTTDGMDSVICIRCGAGSVNAIPAKGHSMGGVVSNGPNGGHTYHCSNCGAAIKTEAHSSAAGAISCSVCGQGY